MHVKAPRHPLLRWRAIPPAGGFIGHAVIITHRRTETAERAAGRMRQRTAQRESWSPCEGRAASSADPPCGLSKRKAMYELRNSAAVKVSGGQGFRFVCSLLSQLKLLPRSLPVHLPMPPRLPQRALALATKERSERRIF